MKARRIAASVTIVAAATLGGMSIGSANASSPTLQTVQKVETLISPKCYHEHQVTHTYFKYSTKAGRYVSEPVRTSVIDQNHCHA
jgi:hypothetical protein